MSFGLWLKRRRRRLGLLIAAGLGLFFGAGIYRSKGAPATQAAATDSGRNVIFITWDGVRREEFLGTADPSLIMRPTRPPPALLRFFWQTLAPTGQIYGDPARGAPMTIANASFISLPAYQSIFTGSTQLCESNDCSRPTTMTFPERLKTELGLPPEQVASFASWEGLADAVQSQPGLTYVNAGVVDVHETPGADEDSLNERQKAQHPPWEDCRFDKYTWRHAMRYLDKHKPRFLYISLDDSDGWGHNVRYERYLSTLQQYDTWLQELVGHLREMGAYGKNTCLVVTTDHGRGIGEKWYTHSNGELHSGMVLMYAGCPLAQDPPAFVASQRLTTHLDIRPTIEALFGLEPHDCLICGRSLVNTARLEAH